MAIFGPMPTKIPKSSANIERVVLTSAELGARESHLPKLAKNPKNAVKHVPQGR